MKKIISLLLALVMVLSLATVAFAEDDTTTITIEKEYKLTNAGTKSPAETFAFTALTCTGITNVGLNAAGEAYYTTANAPVPTINSIPYEAGEAGSSTAKKNATITLPAYEAVGVYTYTFSEIDGNTAGVTYYDKTLTLVVTVIQDTEGKVRVAAVHCESPVDTSNANGTKTNKFENTYSAGNLSITKNVTGNLGDREKQFKMTVTFTAPTGDTVSETISFNDGEAHTIAAGWTGTKTVDIYVKHGETVTFGNIPYGVTYTIDEDDYSGDGYDAPTGEVLEAATVNAATHEHTIVNNKTTSVDTGIALDSAPYFVILAVALFGMVALVSKKRYEV